MQLIYLAHLRIRSHFWRLSWLLKFQHAWIKRGTINRLFKIHQIIKWAKTKTKSFYKMAAKRVQENAKSDLRFPIRPPLNEWLKNVGSQTFGSPTLFDFANSLNWLELHSAQEFEKRDLWDLNKGLVSTII